MYALLISLFCIVVVGNQFVVAIEEVIVFKFFNETNQDTDPIEIPFELNDSNVVTSVSDRNGIIRRILYSEFIEKCTPHVTDPDILSKMTVDVTATTGEPGSLSLNPTNPIKTFLSYSKYLELSKSTSSPSMHETCFVNVYTLIKPMDVVKLHNTSKPYSAEIVFLKTKFVSEIESTVLELSASNQEVEPRVSSEDNLLYVRISQNDDIYIVT